MINNKYDYMFDIKSSFSECSQPLPEEPAVIVIAI